jgi:hypothetical protein
MSERKDVTAPDDDENYGHGGVEVPIDDIEDVPGAPETDED